MFRRFFVWRTHPPIIHQIPDAVHGVLEERGGDHRELATEEQARQWFAILPKDGQWDNRIEYDRRKRTVRVGV